MRSWANKRNRVLGSSSNKDLRRALTTDKNGRSTADQESMQLHIKVESSSIGNTGISETTNVKVSGAGVKQGDKLRLKRDRETASISSAKASSPTGPKRLLDLSVETEGTGVQRLSYQNRV
ncbi:hypothetical protein AOL_s00169g3 [Orbilia oligospora ATCC 24927]|uniref:Uncharacterized protein n=1 Tax=Arthrobotrys oligospora (strain ATCC 24927 / CBS 115.81 / DSM 1491) TaxID=756982 RepID=G1XMF0_ARTOA|nr:hypothetical protein AOL_s00169g3 [Orbilia oligospora ATCC 24927]EGX45669.1 hypothetical protein AOL_s00169g3 [Orbilia oligospora ATCC 24927]